MAMTALEVYEAMKHPPLKRHIDKFGKIICGIDNNIFTVSESVDCP
jgi:hypothetical protein